MAKIFSQHPAGLVFLFLTELWERFGYYLMIGIFTLYMEDTAKGGLGFAAAKSTDVFGTFIALAYLTPFLGGMIADKALGYRRAIVLGGILMGVGYCCLGFLNQISGLFIKFGASQDDAVNYGLWFSLIVMIIGNGFFKPNISTLLGNLYNEEKYKIHKDVGYNIFYMGINIGAFICNFVAAYMRGHWGWGAAFITAGVGMFLGVIVFIAGNKEYEHADVKREHKQGEQDVFTTLAVILVPALLSAVLGWMIPGNIFGNDSTDAFLFFTIPVIGYYLNVLRTAPQHEKQPIKALLAIYAVCILFWAIFKQNGTALTGWAERYTDREVPASVIAPMEVFGMTQTITCDSAMYPKYVDKYFRTEKDANNKVIKVKNTHPYFINAPELMPQKGGKVSLISTEIFQSINPFFVVILTPVVIAFFAGLRRKKKEPSTATKIGWGLMITSLSSILMVFATIACHNGLEKASAWWLIGTYGVVTVGELCLSPMGLSLVSKLAPARIAALMMGGWQLSTSIGNKLSGVLAGMWDRFDDKSNYFLMNTALTFVAGLMIFAMLRWLNGVISANENKEINK